jgi:hypothetical protein
MMLGALSISACGNAAPGWTGGTDGLSPQTTARALGSTFVGISGSGFPAMGQAIVTGTTSRGSATVQAMTDNGGRLNTSVAVPDGFQGSMSVNVTVGSASASATVNAGGNSGQKPADDAGIRPLSAVGCTVTADVGSIPDVEPGDVVCLNGDSSSRLTISTGGTEGSPITYSGGGNSTVRGIDVVASNVVVEGFTSKDGENMGARLQGDNITFQDNTITHPVYRGDDTDGLRFFGDGIKIVHNTIADVGDGSNCNEDGCGDGPHPDCMQTFYSDQYPTSSDVTIEGNRCEDIAAQCLIGEGPVIPGENVNGPGQSLGWTFYDNSCDAGAAQSVQLKDIKNATIVGNTFKGSNNKAVALSDASTGAHVGGNEVSSSIGKLITFDDGLEAPGYIGPAPDHQ